MKLKVHCNFCGKELERYPSQIKGKSYFFCSRKCLANFSSKEKNPNGYASLKDYRNMSMHLSELNRELNPTRMTDATRKKLRNTRIGSGKGKTYTKYYGTHEHRIVAEKILGRKLMQGEIVHHIDGNKRNNIPDNLLILPSQSEHAKLHMRERRFWEGGDAK